MLPSTAASFIGGLQYFGDHPPNFMGLDPLFLTIAATASCAGLGYLIGPLVGSSLWRLTHRRTLGLIEARDREFHHHIVRNRVDPTRQSATNPVPDFYGMSLLTSLVVKGHSLIPLQAKRLGQCRSIGSGCATRYVHSSYLSSIHANALFIDSGSIPPEISMGDRKVGIEHSMNLRPNIALPSCTYRGCSKCLSGTSFSFNFGAVGAR